MEIAENKWSWVNNKWEIVFQNFYLVTRGFDEPKFYRLYFIRKSVVLKFWNPLNGAQINFDTLKLGFRVFRYSYSINRREKNELFRCKILNWIFFIITNFVLSFMFFIIKDNNLILGISVRRFLKFETQGLLKMEFLRWSKI